MIIRIPKFFLQQISERSDSYPEVIYETRDKYSISSDDQHFHDFYNELVKFIEDDNIGSSPKGLKTSAMATKEAIDLALEIPGERPINRFSWKAYLLTAPIIFADTSSDILDYEIFTIDVSERARADVLPRSSDYETSELLELPDE